MADALDALNALQRLEGGSLITKLYDALTETADEVLRASVKSGQKVTKGQVVLTLDIEHGREWERLLIVVNGQIKKTLPKSQPTGASFYAFESSFHGRNPLEPQLPSFREVPLPENTDRNIDPAAAASREIAQ